MTRKIRVMESACLDEGDLYGYVTGSPGARSVEELELHLVRCSACREELAGLLQLLHPEAGDTLEAEPECASSEIQRNLDLIRSTSADAANKRPRRRWYYWGVAAAAAVILCLAAVSLRFYESAKAETLSAQARAALQHDYTARSPNDLRLDLPFVSDASQRSAEPAGSLEHAETFFNRALGVQNGLREPLLGLGYIYLRQNRFGPAIEQFQHILDSGRADAQALSGRGVARFEAAMATTDPSVRSSSLDGALADFEGILQLKPDSNEARFNKVRTLFELGRHQQAVREIDVYLGRDPDSIWARKLKDLRTRILMNRSELLEREVRRAARARDAPALERLARIVPEKIPPLIRSLLLESLTLAQETAGDPSGPQWAAATLEAARRTATDDTSGNALLEFCRSLPPSRRKVRHELNTRLEQLIASFSRGGMLPALKGSDALVSGFERMGDHWQLVRLYQLRGTARFYGLSDYNGASVEYGRMLHRAELSTDPDLIARALAALSSSYGEEARYDEALAVLSRLKQLADSSGLQSWAAFACNSLGATYLKLNQLHNSLQEYSTALAGAYRTMDHESLVLALENLGVVMERMARYPEARRYYAEAGYLQTTLLSDGTLRTTPETEARRLNLLTKEGSLALQLRDFSEAQSHFEQALQRPLGSMREVEARARIGLAQVFIEKGRLSEAEGEVKRALEIAATTLPEVAWQAHSLSGFLLVRAGDQEAALRHFKTAAGVLERMRTRIASPDLRRSFLARRFDPYREMIPLLLNLRKAPNEILAAVDRAKSMTLRESLRARADAQDAPNPSRPVNRTPIPLPPHTATVEYFLCPDQAFAFVSGENGTKVVRLDVSLNELESSAAEYAESIRTGSTESFSTLSRGLYETLIGPLLPAIGVPSVQALVILPDGPLHLLPFGSLIDPAGRYLLERYALSFAPSRSVLNACLAAGKAANFTRRATVLLMDGTSNLSGAARELARIGALFERNSRIATFADLRSLDSSLGMFEIIHFSGHAEVRHGMPALVFGARPHESHLESSVIHRWRLTHNRLVTLAGCNTGIGPVAGGEMPWGLVPAFLSAGAPAVLATVLPAEDADTSRLTSRFYELLAQGGVSKAGALRDAQLSLIRGASRPEDSRPITWAPFVLVGDPR